MQEIILLGGGGHARVLIDMIRLSGGYKIIGVIDMQLEVGSSVSGISVLGNDDMLPELYKRGIKNVCIGIGSVRSNKKRAELFQKAKQIGFLIPELIHPKAIFSNDIQISEGVQIMAGAVIQTGSIIKENTIINTSSIIEHDCRIGKHVHVSPGAVISGECIIDNGAFIGAGSTVIQGVKIGKEAVIGAGSVVIKDVPDGAVVKGIPAR